MESSLKSNTVFYDAECGFCSASIRWIQKWDQKKIFSYLPLQSNSIDRIPSDIVSAIRSPKEWKSVVFFHEGNFYIRSDAILQIAKELGGVFFILSFFLSLVPRRIRDFAYDQVAKIRYQLGKSSNTCKLPS